MKLFKEIFLVILAVVVFAEDFPEEEDVMVLGKDNFDRALETYEHILVEFYAPWCGHCKALAPNYAKAAKMLKDEGSQIRLGKVDATIHADLASKYEVRGYPTIKFFKNGAPVDYAAGREAEDIVTWLKKKTGPPAETLSTKEAVEKLIESGEAVAIGYFSDPNSDPAKAFLSAASRIDSLPVGIVTNEAVTKAVDAEQGSIVVYKKFDEKKAVYSGEFNADDILQFIQTEQLPLLFEFNDENANRIFGGEVKIHFLIFYPTSDEKTATSIAEAARTAAKDFKGKVIFVSVDTDVEDNARIAEYFGLTEADYPCARLIKLGDEMLKYRPEFSELTTENMKTFLTSYFEGKIKPHLNSEEIPDNWDSKPVKVLVGKNFWDVVKNGEKDVFVEFYAPWCGHCKALAPVWDELAAKFADAKDVMIAKMDSTTNEVEGVSIQGFPTLKYFKKSDPENPVDYAGGRTLDDLVKYVESRGTDDGVKTPDDIDNEFFESLEDEDFEDMDEPDDGDDGDSGEEAEDGESMKDEL